MGKLKYGIGFRLGLFVSAFAIRISYLLQTRNKIISNYITDSAIYDNWAREIVGTAERVVESFYMGPLYPYFMAMLYRSFGPHKFPILVIQGIISSGSCLLLFAIANKVFGKIPALIAAGLFLLYPVFLFYDGCILAESLLIFLHLATVYSLLAAIDSRRTRWWVAAGILTGLAALGRANILLYTFLFLLIHVIIHGNVWITTEARKRKRRLLRRRRLGYSVLICAALTLLVIMPATIRNYVVSKDFVFITSNLGFNFFIGNNPQASGDYRTPREIVLQNDLTGKLTAEKQVGHSLKSSEVSRFWFSRGMEFARNNPKRFFVLFLNKIRLFWNSYEIPQAENLYFTQQYSPLLRIPLLNFGLIAPLGLLGLVVSLGSWRRLYPLHIFIFSYGVSVVIFFVVSRYRIHVVPFLMIFAAFGIHWILKTFTSRRLFSRYSILGLGILTGFFLLVNLQITGFNPDRAMAEGYNTLGFYYAHFYRDYGEAIRSYRKALVYQPGDAETYNNLATTYLRMEAYERSIEIFRKLTKMEPERWIFHYNLGIAYCKIKRFEEAVKALEEAVRLGPGSIEAARALKSAKNLRKETEAEK